jgi:acetyl esterase/lipase
MLPVMPKSILLAMFAGAVLYAQLSPQATWAVESQNHYAIRPNITYGTQNNFETKLDIYQRRDVTGPQPTVIFIHGGGWVGGTKEGSAMSLLPWMELGWNIVNVEYRLGRVSLAPAAVEDCLCALRWIAAHAKDYNFDVARLVLTGESAGGHLALTTGMIPQSAGLDRQCPGVDLPKAAAIVNWYGITDVNDVLDGPHQKTYAVAWFASLPDKVAIAKRISPLEYIRRDLPPILTIHGDADPTVPYTNATRLRDALSTAGVPNQLLTIPGGGHGNFKPDERVKIFVTIREFLTKYRVM